MFSKSQEGSLAAIIKSLVNRSVAMVSACYFTFTYKKEPLNVQCETLRVGVHDLSRLVPILIVTDLNYRALTPVGNDRYYRWRQTFIQKFFL